MKIGDFLSKIHLMAILVDYAGANLDCNRALVPFTTKQYGTYVVVYNTVELIGLG
jgi:hypothetical protein